MTAQSTSTNPGSHPDNLDLQLSSKNCTPCMLLSTLSQAPTPPCAATHATCTSETKIGYKKPTDSSHESIHAHYQPSTHHSPRRNTQLGLHTLKHMPHAALLHMRGCLTIRQCLTTQAFLGHRKAHWLEEDMKCTYITPHCVVNTNYVAC